MRVMASVLLLGAVASAQASPARSEVANPPSASPQVLIIPAGTKVPVVLKHAISTHASREGDGVYAETAFPVVANGRLYLRDQEFIYCYNVRAQ